MQDKKCRGVYRRALAGTPAGSREEERRKSRIFPAIPLLLLWTGHATITLVSKGDSNVESVRDTPFDRTINECTDKEGVFHPSFPREDNLAMVRKVKIPAHRVILREAKPNGIQHNKFNRLFNHYYFRCVAQATAAAGRNASEDSLFLKERAEEWLVKYEPGKLRQKRVEMFAKMKGFA